MSQPQKDTCRQQVGNLPWCRLCLQEEQKVKTGIPEAELTENGQPAVKNECNFQTFRWLYKLEEREEEEWRRVRFADPMTDPKEEDSRLWKINLLSEEEAKEEEPMKIADAEYIFKHLSPYFVSVCREEEALLKLYDVNLKYKPVHANVGSREICDGCQTSVWNSSFTCTTCALSFCAFCYLPKHLRTAETNPKLLQTSRAADNECYRFGHPPGYTLCQRIPGTIMYSLCSLVQNHVTPDEDLNIEEDQDVKPEDLDPDENGNLKVEYMAREECDTPEGFARFQKLLALGVPIVVKGAGKRLSKALWKMDALVQRFGDTLVSMLNAQNMSYEKVPLKIFLQMARLNHLSLGDRADLQQLKEEYGMENEMGPLKVRDWPNDEDLSKLCDERLADLDRAWPFQKYMSRNGVYNLAPNLPAWLIPADIGPKGYLSMRTKGKGTTNFHKDLTDAVNIMVVTIAEHKSRSRKPLIGAHWLIYPTRFNKDINVYMKEEQKKRKDKKEAKAAAEVADGGVSANLVDDGSEDEDENLDDDEVMVDPIQAQRSFFSKKSVARLKERGIPPWSIDQYQYDAIVIPSDCVHAVQNQESCLKFATDYICVERLAKCLKLRLEARQLTPEYANYVDKLQIKSVMYFSMLRVLAVMLSDEKYRHVLLDTRGNILKDVINGWDSIRVQLGREEDPIIEDEIVEETDQNQTDEIMDDENDGNAKVGPPPPPLPRLHEIADTAIDDLIGDIIAEVYPNSTGGLVDTEGISIILVNVQGLTGWTQASSLPENHEALVAFKANFRTGKLLFLIEHQIGNNFVNAVQMGTPARETGIHVTEIDTLPSYICGICGYDSHFANSTKMADHIKKNHALDAKLMEHGERKALKCPLCPEEGDLFLFDLKDRSLLDHGKKCWRVEGFPGGGAHEIIKCIRQFEDKNDTLMRQLVRLPSSMPLPLEKEKTMERINLFIQKFLDRPFHSTQSMQLHKPMPVKVKPYELRAHTRKAEIKTTEKAEEMTRRLAQLVLPRRATHDEQKLIMSLDEVDSRVRAVTGFVKEYFNTEEVPINEREIKKIVERRVKRKDSGDGGGGGDGKRKNKEDNNSPSSSKKYRKD